MAIDMSDINRITMDYLFGDRDRVMDTLMAIVEFGDEDSMNGFVKECESRGISMGQLIVDAYAKRDRIAVALRSGAIVSGGSEIRVPLQYRVKQ